MKSKDKQVLQKIYNHIKSILRYCMDCTSLDDFQANSMCVEACVFNLMQIGELAKTELSDEIKLSMTSIPWKQIYGLRNRIVHGYSGVDMNIIWDVIQNDLVPLKNELEKYLEQ